MWEYRHTDELYHYGILGMRWGVRRYQNPDGSLTPAGRERYGVVGKMSGDRGFKTPNSGDIFRSNSLDRMVDGFGEWTQKKLDKELESQKASERADMLSERARIKKKIDKELSKERPNESKLDKLGRKYSEVGGILEGHYQLNIIDDQDYLKHLHHMDKVKVEGETYDFWIDPYLYYLGDGIVGGYTKSESNSDKKIKHSSIQPWHYITADELYHSIKKK